MLDLAQLARDTGAALADADHRGAATAATFLRTQMPAVHHALRHASEALPPATVASLRAEIDRCTAGELIEVPREVLHRLLNAPPPTPGDCRECPYHPTPADAGTNRYGNGG